jgi:hypothetical protein
MTQLLLDTPHIVNPQGHQCESVKDLEMIGEVKMASSACLPSYPPLATTASERIHLTELK